MKPENAINVPEKYRNLPSQSKSTEVRGEEDETYDIDPRQAAVEDVDLSKVNVSNDDLSIVMTTSSLQFFSSSVKQDPEGSPHRTKVRKVLKGKKKMPRDLKPKPLRKVFPKKQGDVKRIKFGTRVVPKKVYDPLSL